MSKIIFVGLHNKPGKMPLCGSTKSGKLIDRIIKEGNLQNWQKSNLFDTDYLPRTDWDKIDLAGDWAERVDAKQGDIAILLGALVHEYFQEWVDLGMIKIAHPASRRSHESMNEYVQSTINKIKSHLTHNKQPQFA